MLLGVGCIQKKPQRVISYIESKGLDITTFVSSTPDLNHPDKIECQHVLDELVTVQLHQAESAHSLYPLDNSALPTLNTSFNATNRSNQLVFSSGVAFLTSPLPPPNLSTVIDTMRAPRNRQAYVTRKEYTHKMIITEGGVLLDVSVVIESIVALFIMVLVGIYARRRKIITDEMNKGLINILIQIALPFMILSSFLYTYDSTIKANVIKTVYYSVVAYILMIAVSYLLLQPVKNDKKTILHFANVFVNTGYVGFPILNSMYGPEGVVYGSIFNIFFVLLLWTYGIVLFKGRLNAEELKLELKKALLNPSILAVCAGLVIMSFNIKLPGVIISASRDIGHLTGPLSMMIIGGILSKVKIKKYLCDWTLYYGVTIKLIIIPMIIYLAAFLIGSSSIAINTVIIMTALPASAMTSIFAETFDKEKEYAAFVVSATTLLSLFTVILLIKYVLQ